MSSHLRTLWTAEPAATLRGATLAREGGRVLAWSTRHGLFLFDGRGRRDGELHAPADLVSAALSGNGQRVATVDSTGLLRLLNGDLSTCWEQPVPHGLAVAVDCYGDRTAVADGAGNLQLFDGQGKRVWSVSGFRPVRFLTFVPEATALVGSADFGLVICLDRRGRTLWRDAPVTHTGSLSTSGDGAGVYLARYSDGLCRYGLQASQPRAVRGTAPCRLADVSYDGRVFLTGGLDERICLRDADGSARADLSLSDRPVALALAPLADRAVVALASGRVHMLSTRDT